MKKMMILAACATALCTTANAQINFAPEIGLNLANMHDSYKTSTGEKKTLDDGIKLGVKVGANVNIPVGERLVIQPGLFYSIKGTKREESETVGTISYTGKDNITLHYFDVAVNVQYMFNDPSEGRLFVGLGPFMGVAFSGHNKNTESSTVGGVTTSHDTTIDLHFGNDYPSNDMRRFDFGGQVNVGYLLRSGIFFRGMYQQGFFNLVPQGNMPSGISSLEQKSNNTNITISVGYMLGGAPKGKGPKMKGSAPM